VFAVYYRPDLQPLAEEFKSRYGAIDLTCSGQLSHVFILGGDGTLLEALRRFPCVLDSVVVHLGMGRVNFYRSAEFTIPVEEAVAKIRRGEYRVLEFSTLEHDGCRALNEISIYRREPGRLLSFRIKTDEGEVVGRADGVIISTPHGSSGYVVSTFGPVVDYRVDAVVISFIAPYTLFLRPLVLMSSQVAVETGEDAILVCDGRETRQGRSFLVKKGEKRLKLAVFGKFQFLHRVMGRLQSI
jgi:NAD+ kinase